MVKTVQAKQRSEPLAPGDGIVRDEILYLPLGSIDPDPDQPRLSVDDELADSIKQHGVLQAIQVRPHPRDADRWMLVDGERRWTGAKRAHQATIPATITLEVEDTADRIVRQLVRNEGKPLTPVEEALAFKKIIDARHAAGDKKYGVVQLAREVGVAKSTISDRLTLTEIPSFWLELIAKGPLQASHAPLLHKWRLVPEKYQRIAFEQMKKDYRWTNRRTGGKTDERIYVDVFDTLLDTFFPKFTKPLSEVPGYEGPTQVLTVHNSYPPRRVVHAMDPSKWGPIFRKRAAAKRASAPKKSSRQSDTDWRAQQEREQAKREAERQRWAAGTPAILEQVAKAIQAATSETLVELLLDRLTEDESDAEAAERAGFHREPAHALEFLAFAYLRGEIVDDWNGQRRWPQIAKQLGITPAKAEKKKRGKKAKESADAPPAELEPDDELLVGVEDFDHELEEVAP